MLQLFIIDVNYKVFIKRILMSMEKVMQKWQDIINIFLIFLICIVMLVCGNNRENNTGDKWALIIKELKVTLSSDNPDSIKINRIKNIFNRYQIGLEDYQKFYHENIKENPLKSTNILKAVENQLMEDLKNISKEKRKNMEAYNRGLKKED